ncbi:MAG: acetate--CoA ligase family protein [Pseudomonadota bacterium]
MTRDLSRVFQPKSIAVIGGGFWGNSVVEQCLKMGFSGPIWPVHPRKDSIAGQRAVARLEDLPQAPDATFIGVNRHVTIDAVRQLRDMGAGGAVCFASGFREAQSETGDGADLQEALLAAAGQMPIVGPNCYGFINYLDGALLWPDQHGGERVDRGVAILTQSSNIAINLTMHKRGLPLAYVATAGNQAQIGGAEIATALLKDARVTALGLHIEGIGDLRAFEGMAEAARRLGKPIVALKAGKSEQAQAAAVSHTASLAGSDAGARALLRRLGIAQVDSLTALLETLKLLHFTGPLPRASIASLSCSGGEASLMADTAEGRAITFPPLSKTQTSALRDALGPMVALNNPLDYHTFIWNDAERMAQTFSAVLTGEAALGCLVADFPRADRCDPTAWQCLIEAGAAVMRTSKVPLALVSTLPEALPEDVTVQAVQAGMIPMHGLDDTLTAIEQAAFLGRSRAEHAPVLIPGSPENTEILTEAEAKDLLRTAGVPVPASRHARGYDALTEAAQSLSAPLALKAQGLAHKTEMGGVALNLTDADAVVAAAREMPGDEFLLEEMVDDAVAELLVGVIRDPAHGFVLTVGAGGILTELLADTTSLLLPATAEEIETALNRLRIAPLLKGYRGRPAAAMTPIVGAISSLGSFVQTHRDSLDEVEINPLICTPTRAVAVDALIRIGM